MYVVYKALQIIGGSQSLSQGPARWGAVDANIVCYVCVYTYRTPICVYVHMLCIYIYIYMYMYIIYYACVLYIYIYIERERDQPSQRKHARRDAGGIQGGIQGAPPAPGRAAVLRGPVATTDSWAWGILSL